MSKYWKHFKTVIKHKWLVMILMFKCGYYWQGIMHDMSKFSPTEFCSSAKYFQGDKSPIDAEKTERGYSIAWQHHKGHNPHHWEYWIDNLGNYKNTPIPIPFKFIVEMVCDWISAGIVYSGQKCDFSKPYGEPYEFHEKVKQTRIFHWSTINTLEWMLLIIKNQGVNAYCKMIRKYRYYMEDIK